MRVTPQGDTVGSFPICNREDSQFGPSIVFDGENYLAAWSDRRFNKLNWWLTVARISPTGVVLDTGHIAGAQGACNEYYPSLAFDGHRALAVWYHSFYAPWGVYGRFINTQAQGEDSVFRIAETRTHFYNLPRLAFGEDAYFITWADHREGSDDFDIRGRLVSTDGRLLGTEQFIATGPEDQRKPDVSWDGSEYLVVWSESGIIKGRRVGADGSARGLPFAVSDTTGNARNHPKVVAGAAGRLAVWTERRGAHTDIYGVLLGAPGIGEAGRGARRSASPTVMNAARFAARHGQSGVYDRNGRRLGAREAGAGVYFILAGDGDVRKVLLVR